MSSIWTKHRCIGYGHIRNRTCTLDRGIYLWGDLQFRALAKGTFEKAGTEQRAGTRCGASPNAVFDFGVPDCVRVRCGDEESASPSILKLKVRLFGSLIEI